MIIQKQSLLGYILLLCITGGLYSFFWIYNMTAEINKIAENAGAPPDLIDNPVNEVLFCILTFGIYNYIWVYRQGNKMKMISNERDLSVNEEGHFYVMYMLLGLVTLGIFTFYMYHLFIKNFNILVDDYNSNSPYAAY